MSSQFDVIANHQFDKLWLSQLLSSIAYHLLNFALIIRVYQLAQGTRYVNLSVGLLVLAIGIPAVLFAPIAGVYVDHWDRKIVFVAANYLRAILVLGFLVFEVNLALVLALAFVISLLTQLFAPAEAASIPQLVGPENILAANSLFLFTFYAAFVIGYSGAAPIIKHFGVHAPYLWASVLFFAAGLFSNWLPRLAPPEAQRASFLVIIHNTRSELGESWKLITGNANIYFSIIQLSLTQAVIGVVLALAPAISLALLREQLVEASNILIIPAGLGMVLGVVLVAKLSRKIHKIKLINWALIAAGLSLSALGASGQLYRVVHGKPVATPHVIAIIVAVFVLTLGLMNSFIGVAAQTLLQENSTEKTRGKIFGVLYMMINLAATVPIFLAGLLADLFSVTKVVLATGIVLIVFGLLQARHLRTPKGKHLLG